jgi:lipopolysaccharide/colanic/teichoic acid biosynthesis glycosyltransferase
MKAGYTKRVFDVLLTSFGLVVLSPIIILLVFLVLIKLGSPVLFIQNRPGLYGKPFRIYKFRTMTDERGVDGDPLPDVERLVGFGRFFRSTSLDELPELFNVIKGDMSLVGPRPLLMEYLGRYSAEQARRHEIKPGITGWAQVNGRNTLSWEDKFRLDVWYVDNQSLWLDVKILALTVWKTIKRENINGEGHATMSKFMGSGRNV